jgi:hypothetical protein
MKYLRGGTERTCLSGGDKSVDIIQISIVEYQAFLVEEIPHSLLFVSLPIDVSWGPNVWGRVRNTAYSYP